MEAIRKRTARIIFKTDTRTGWLFDVGLLLTILASVIIVILESVQPIKANWGAFFYAAEWALTVLFTIEYGLRIWSSSDRKAYVTSFFGVVDLLSIVPTYLSALVPGLQSLMVIRAVRLVRVFNVFKLRAYLAEETMLARALKASSPKILVFLVLLANVVVIVGAVMYVVEGPEAGFSSVPRGIYWAVVTISTVGFGDITPITALGQTIAGLLMMLGYCLIIVPTALVSAELALGVSGETQIKRCNECGLLEHPGQASFCHRCGHNLHGGPLNSPFGP